MTPRQRLLAVFAALNVLILLVGWFVLVSPQRHDAASAAAQEQLVQNELEALTGKTSQTSTKQPAIHTSDLYALDTALPAQEDQPDLLFELDRLAKASYVDVLAVSPLAPQATTTGYTVQPINLQLSGTYFHIDGFLRSVRLLVSEHDGRLIANGPLFAVTAVSLAPGSNTRNEIATVGLATFYYGTVGGASAPASTTTTDTTTTTGG